MPARDGFTRRGHWRRDDDPPPPAHKGPKGSLLGMVPLLGICPQEAQGGLADRGQLPHRGLCSSPLSPRGTLEIPGRVHFLDLSPQSLEHGVSSRPLSDLTSLKVW